VGGVGVLIGKGINQRPRLSGGVIHDCEFAHIQMNRGFAPPFSDSTLALTISDMELSRCWTYGILLDGHYPQPVALSNIRISGNDETLPVAGVCLRRSEDELDAQGISRMIMDRIIISGFETALLKEYENQQGVATSGQKLSMHQCELKSDGEYSFIWRGANGSATDCELFDKPFDVARLDGTFNHFMIAGVSEAFGRRGYAIQTFMDTRGIVLDPANDIVLVRGNVEAVGDVQAHNRLITSDSQGFSGNTTIKGRLFRGRPTLMVGRIQG
jgi:hypothetical protein